MQLDAVGLLKLLLHVVHVVVDGQHWQANWGITRVLFQFGVGTKCGVGDSGDHQVWQLVFRLAPAEAGLGGLDDRLGWAAGISRDAPYDVQRRLEVVVTDGDVLDTKVTLAIATIHRLNRIDQVESETNAAHLLVRFLGVVGQRIVFDRHAGLLVVDDATESLTHADPVLLEEDHAPPYEHHSEGDDEDCDADPVRRAVVFDDHFVNCTTAETEHRSHHLSFV